MPKDFDKFAKRLQKEIIKKEIEDHNVKIVDFFYNPQNWGILPNEETTVFEELRGGPKEYFLGLYLKIENNLISKAQFVTDGCGVMVATGCQMTLLIKGKSVEFAEHLRPEDIISALGGIPLGEKHCIDLAIDTLKNAIKKYKIEK